MVWRRHISQSTARRRHSMLVVVICDPPTLASSSFHARGQVTATVVLPFMVPSCRILCHTTCGQLTSLWSLSEIDRKHSCLTLTRSSAFAALANLGYISDIIIIIIITKFCTTSHHRHIMSHTSLSPGAVNCMTINSRATYGLPGTVCLTTCYCRFNLTPPLLARNATKRFMAVSLQFDANKKTLSRCQNRSLISARDKLCHSSCGAGRSTPCSTHRLRIPPGTARVVM